MKGISKKEIEIISWLEFHKKYFFISSDIDKFAKNKTQRYNIIKSMIKKERIVKINRSKYYLIPIKAKGGKWTEHPYIIIDEICNGKDYFIGGWSAANYWRLTDQIAFKFQVYTTRRQGKIKILSTAIIFYRTTPKRISKAVTEEIWNHKFRIICKKESRKWMRSRN